jgi:GDP-L-fucose synthase
VIFLSKPKVLLTGGRGMVGRSVQNSPRAQQYTVFAPDRGELDLLNKDAVDQYVRQLKPDVVIHAAGTVGGIQVKFLSDNVQMGINLIIASKNAGVNKLLNLASTCIYPRDSDGLLNEEMVLGGPLEPTNEGYALAKIVVARLCEYIVREDPSFQYKTLIPCNLYGPHDTFDERSSHLLPAIVRKIDDAYRKKEDRVLIWGDGTARREFMYVDDLSRVIWEAAEQIELLPSMMNVGVGTDHSVLEYYQIAAKVIGWTGQFEFDLSKPSGMKRKLSSVSGMQKFGWSATTSLEDGLKKTHSYYVTEVFDTL